MSDRSKVKIGDKVNCYSTCGSKFNPIITAQLIGIVHLDEHGRMCVDGNHLALGCAEFVEIIGA